MEIIIESKTSSISKLRAALESYIPNEVDLRSGGNSNYRSIDPTVLIAIVGATSGLIGGLIGGLFKVLEQTNASRLVIVGSKGGRIELPATASDEMLQRAIDAAQQLDIERITLLS